MKLSELSVKRPVFATMMIGALLVLGWFSYTMLSVRLFPEIDFPITVVQTVYPGASAETVETEVSKEIEDAINEVSGIRHIQTVSSEGYSLIIVEFELERDGTVATQDVREKVAGVRSLLPEDIDEPIVSQFDPMSQPIMYITVAGNRPIREVTELSKNIVQRRLEGVSGVGSVRLIGGREREIQVALNLEQMEALGVTVDDVRNSVAAANMEIPGGRVDEAGREYLVRMAGRLETVGAFRDIVVKKNNGVPVFLKDIAVVADSVEEQRSLARYNGNPAVAVEVIQQSGSNVVDVAEGVREELSLLDEELPPDVVMTVVQDNSVFIRDSIHEILFNIQFGTILAIIVIYLFLLNWRPTIITGLSIPISIIAAFTIMNTLGFTINFMTLLGLSLAVGILIDDAIVVIENIYRHMEEGRSAMEAAVSGTKEIGLAVMATTFSIVAVFVPVAFMEGIVGRFFLEFGITVAFAVLISLFVAFTLTPMLSSRFLTDENGGRRVRGLSKVWDRVRSALSVWNRTFEKLKDPYKRTLTWALQHRVTVVLIATLSFAAAIGLTFTPLVGSEFVPQADQSKLGVNFDTPPGTTLEETSQRAAQIEQVLRDFEEVTGIYVAIGGENVAVQEGRILCQLVPINERDYSDRQLMDSVRYLLRDIPGINYAVNNGEQAEGGTDKPITLSVQGQDLDQIRELVHEVEQIVKDIPGAVDVDNSLEEGKPEIRVEVDRKYADDLGLSLYTIPTTVRDLVEGDDITQFKDGNEEYDVRMRLQERFRGSVDDLGRILIVSTKEIPGVETVLLPLDRVARLYKEEAIGQYNRYDRKREARVGANAATGFFAGTITNQAMERVNAEIDLPPGYEIKPIGEAELMTESFQNIFKALILAVVFIYLLLASQYESFWDPFSIMLSLPLSLIGAILGLIGSSFSIMSLIGIVLLMGLVTKNAILLIDFVKQQREKGVQREEAIKIAGPIRLRPILMTTFATVFGMLPLALGLGPGAEMRASMARAAIGGMISSTLLTLVVVPVVYTIVEDFVNLFRRKKGSDRSYEEHATVTESKTEA